MKVKANFNYKDKQLDRLVKKGEVIDVDETRAKILCETTYNNIPFCSIVENDTDEKEDNEENQEVEEDKQEDQEEQEEMEEKKEEKKVETATPKKRGRRKAVKETKVEE